MVTHEKYIAKKAERSVYVLDGKIEDVHSISDLIELLLILLYPIFLLDTQWESK